MMMMPSLRILLVGDFPDDPRLGSAKVAHKLREEFRAAGHECDALFTADIGVRPSNRQLRQLVAPVQAAQAMTRAFHRGSYDVVDASSAEGLWFGVRKRMARGRRPTALICRSHGLEHLNYRRMLDDSRAGLVTKPWPRRIWYPASRLTQVALAARVADRLLLLNAVDRAFALERRWQPPDRIDVIPHGISDRYLQPDAVYRTRGRGALFCGSWDNAKGVRYLVDAFSQLANSGRPVPLTILGPGAPAPFIRRQFGEAARQHVTVLDRMPEDRVIEEFRQHDLLVFPSTYEGFGLVVIEAMSQGLPVVATPVGCAVSVVRDGLTGRAVPPRDASALATAVSELMNAPDERVRMGANAAMAVSEMSWRATAQQTLTCYRRALEQTRGPA
jgi:glycosyltransferase involved in cell wall biosynthesis